MEKVIKETGFEPILEKIFKPLDSSTLLMCQSVCKYWNQVVQNPSFLLKQLELAKMPIEIHRKWKELTTSLQDQIALLGDLSKCLLWALEFTKDGFFSPETAASSLGFVPLLKFISNNAKINFSGDGPNKSTPLHCAALYGHLEALKFLAKLTENLTIENKYRATPIHSGAKSGKVEIMKYFQEMGCDLNDYMTFDPKRPIIQDFSSKTFDPKDIKSKDI